MRTFHALAACLLTTGIAFAAEGDAQIDPLSKVMAAAVEDLMVPTNYTDWGYGWTALGTRPRDIHWHLAAPSNDQGERDFFLRTGWIEAGGRQARVSVCGTADRVTTITFNDHGRFGGASGGNDLPLVTALRENGVDMTELSRNDPSSDIFADDYSFPYTFAEYELRPNGRVPARLRAHEGCTNPNARSAMRCWTDYVLVLDAEANDDVMSATGMCGVREDQR